MKRKNVIISALVLAIALTGCSGKKVDYNMETENINTKAGSDISAFDDSTKWNDSFSVEISDKSVDVPLNCIYNTSVFTKNVFFNFFSLIGCQRFQKIYISRYLFCICLLHCFRSIYTLLHKP